MGITPHRELLVNLRRELHRFPERSGEEKKTSQRISEFLKKTAPDELIENIGGNGIAARYRGILPGPRVMVRAELDALPIHETNSFDYRSSVPGVAHMCGHDGHMTIAAGVAKEFSDAGPVKGELVVLFQPSEENGSGANEVINDPKFDSIQPDYIIALHNLPGVNRNEVILRDGVFAMASVGMIIELHGKTSHAAEPENGINPSGAVSRILSDLPLLAKRDEFRHFTLATIIHTQIGEIAFGTSPGYAVIMSTLRAYDNTEMKRLTGKAEKMVREIAASENLEVSVKWTENFPATVNDPSLNRIVEKAGSAAGIKVSYIEDAFRWSEDFGWFTGKYRGVLFGLGAGRQHPELHNPDYDFPDEILETGIEIIALACRELFKT